jgi:hypothetical protein
VLISSSWIGKRLAETSLLRITLTKRPLRQRVVAIAAAYAIALAGVIASFGTAQVVAEATGQPDPYVYDGATRGR